jgi:hypothetical protein
MSTQVLLNRVTNNSKTSTDAAQGSTGQAENFTTDLPINIPTNNNTSFNDVRTTNKDDNYTNNNNFKVGDKNKYDTNPIYMYIYGSVYIPS